MGDKSAIEWTEATWNPVTGCSKVSPGCAHCYAETLSLRFGWSPKPWTPENAEENVRLRPERLDQPLKWKRPRMIFVNSMSDLFHELVPEEYIWKCLLVMHTADRHTFQVLTKRPERAREVMKRFYAATHRHLGPSEYRFTFDSVMMNVWLGVSIENAKFTYRADVLREIPAAVRFISAEPLLSSLISPRSPRVLNVAGNDLPQRGTQLGQPLDLKGIDWLIVGGESGAKARPMLIEWARELRDACLEEQARRVRYAATCPIPIQCKHGYDVCPICDGKPAFFFKQWGGRTAKSGGKELDGREWCQMPVAA